MCGPLSADETSGVILSIVVVCLAVVLFYINSITRRETWYLAQVIPRSLSV